MTQIQSKQDVDRIKQRVGARKTALERVRQIATAYREGRGASACMDDIIKALEGVK